jgi:hypothetical protein
MALTIQTICDSIVKLMEKARAPLTSIPATILLCSVIKRPGVSPSLIATNIIRRQTEAGAPVGPNIDGSANISERMELIRVEEILKAIRLDGVVEVAIPTGSITSIGTGANAGGPVTVTSVNVKPVSGRGILR